VNDFDPWALLKNAWVAIAALAGFIFKRHLDEDAERARALAQVQQTYATRDDISELHQKIDENHREVMRVLLRD
jgi:hypothetical protein